jgi:hypothetical protein
MTKAAGYYGRQKRPRSVTLMIWGVILFAIANGWRAIGLSQQGSLLRSLDASLNPNLGVGLAIFWSILFLIAAVALLQRRMITRLSVPVLIFIHGLYQVLLVVIFARSAASRNAWPVIGLLFILAWLFYVCALCRPSVRWYFMNESL